MAGNNDAPGERVRVFLKIAPLILEFHRARTESERRQFHVEDLRTFVQTRLPEIAPDSPGRILRELRLMGRLDYVVTSRRHSLYEFTESW